jgi:catechol 2,3-dioxygenase-like lactoylglutathione lyase family enzyme
MIAVRIPARFHHLGLAVRDFQIAASFYEGLGYSTGDVVFDPQQNVELLYCFHSKMPDIELIKPGAKDSPINNYLSKVGEVVYHTCYAVDSIGTFIPALKRRFRVVDIVKPKPAKLFHNKRVAFFYVKNVGLIELLEMPE